MFRRGRLEEAERFYRASIADIGPLARDYPDVWAYQRRVSSASQGLALTLWEVGRLPEAEVHFRRAMQTQKAKLAESPDDPDQRYAIAYTQLQLDQAGAGRGAAAGGGDCMREAISHLAPLVRDFPHTTQYRATLLEVYHHQFLLHFAEQRLGEAEEVYRQALPHIETLTAEAPDRLWYRTLLHRLRRDYALLMAAAGRPRDAEEAFGRATAAGKALLADFADDHATPIDVANTFGMHGRWLQAAGRHPEAERAFREVLALYDKRPPESAVACGSLAWFLATCPVAAIRDPGRAVELAKRAVELDPPQGRYWTTLARRHLPRRRLAGRRRRPGEVDRASQRRRRRPTPSSWPWRTGDWATGMSPVAGTGGPSSGWTGTSPGTRGCSSSGRRRPKSWGSSRRRRNVGDASRVSRVERSRSPPKRAAHRPGARPAAGEVVSPLSFRPTGVMP